MLATFTISASRRVRPDIPFIDVSTVMVAFANAGLGFDYDYSANAGLGFVYDYSANGCGWA